MIEETKFKLYFGVAHYPHSMGYGFIWQHLKNHGYVTVKSLVDHYTDKLGEAYSIVRTNAPVKLVEEIAKAGNCTIEILEVR